MAGCIIASLTDWKKMVAGLGTCAMYAVLHQCLRADAFPVAEAFLVDAGRRSGRIWRNGEG